MLGDDGNVRRTGAIPVDDGGQALDVRTEHLGERFALGVTRGVGETKAPPLALAVDYLGRMIAERRLEIAAKAPK